jgi:hypothetical protein
VTNENLMLRCEDIFELQHEYPREIEVIMEMLAEAGEGCFLEMNELDRLVA